MLSDTRKCRLPLEDPEGKQMRNPRMGAVWLIGLLILLPGLGCGSSSPTADTATAEATSKGTSGTEGDDVKKWADDLAPWAKKAAAVPEEAFPAVDLKTTFGLIRVKLNRELAPRTVANFLNYVDNGHYNQTIFHRIESGYAVLGGGYTSELLAKEGRYPIPNEAKNGLKNRRGTIAMVRDIDKVDSSTCQFFINLNDNPQLDHQGEEPERYGYCVFGEVIEGMEVLDRIATLPVRTTEGFDKLPVETVMIESARRHR